MSHQLRPTTLALIGINGKAKKWAYNPYPIQSTDSAEESTARLSQLAYNCLCPGYTLMEARIMSVACYH